MTRSTVDLSLQGLVKSFEKCSHIYVMPLIDSPRLFACVLGKGKGGDGFSTFRVELVLVNFTFI